MRTVKLYGDLAKKYGAEHSFDARTPAQLLRALTANYKGFRKDLYQNNWRMICGEGETARPVAVCDLEFPVSRRERTLHLVPHDFRVSGLDPFTQALLLGAALVAGGVALALVLTPKIAAPDANDRETEETNSYVFDGPSNVTEQGHPVPLVYGRMRVGSIVTSASLTNARAIPYDSYAGGGDGYIGDTTPGWLGGTDEWVVSKGGSTSAPRPAVEDPNTLQSQATARLVDVVSEGEIGGLVGGLKGVYFDDTVVQNEDDTFNFKGVEISTREGTPDQGYLAGFPTQEAPVTMSSTEVSIAGGPITTTITNANADRARVTIRLPSLTRQDTTNGDLKANSVSVKISVQADGGGYADVVTKTWNDKCTSPYDEDFEFPLPPGGAPWNVRVTRLTADSVVATDKKDTYFHALTEIIDAKFSHPDTAMVGVTLDARQFGTNIPRRSYLLDGIKVEIPNNYNPTTRVYTGVWGGTFTRGVTSNPAWVFRDLCTNTRYGLGRLMGAAADKYDLYAIAQYCDELVDDGFGSTEPRFQVNGVINTRVQALRLLRDLAAAFDGMLYASSTSLSVIQDSPQEPLHLIVAANTVTGGVTYEGMARENVFSAFVVAYTDTADNYRLGYVVVEDDDYMREFGWKPKDITAFMCTSRGQALRLGRKLRDDQRHRTAMCHYNAGPDHSLASPGTVIEINDPKFTADRRGGLLTTATSTSATVDKGVTLSSGRTYTIKIMLPDGTVATKVLTNSPGSNVTVFTWSGALSPAPKKGAVWSLKDDLVTYRQFRVVSISETNFGEYSLMGILHDPDKYARIEAGLVAEPSDFVAISVGRIEPPAAITLQEYVKEDGNSSIPTVLVSATPSTDPNAVSYDFGYRDQDDNAWTTLHGGGVLWREFVNVNYGLYDFRVRAKNAAGKVGPWREFNDQTLNGPNGSSGIPTVTGLVLYSDGTNAVLDLRWDAVTDSRPVYFEVYRHATTDDFDTATYVGSTTDLRYSISQPGYYYVRARYMSAVGTPDSVSITALDLLNLRDDLDDVIAQVATLELSNSALVFIYKRSATAPTLPSATATYTFASGVVSGLNNGWSASVPATDGNPLYVSVATAYAAASTDTIASGEWATAIIMAQDGTSGTSGSSVATVYLYKRSSSAPSVPSTTSTFTFATGVLTGHDNGWTQSVPTDDGNPLYVILASALGTGTTDTIATGEWATPTVMAANGLNNATVTLYRRHATGSGIQPSTGTATYTFSTGVLTSIPSGWTQTVPAGTDPLYVIYAVASSNVATDTIGFAEWSTAVILVQNGTSGSAGAAGANTALVYLYQRAASAPSVPSTTTTYTFSTGVASGHNNGWSTTVPAGANPCYVTTAVATSNTTTDTIASGDWASPVILVQDGATGAQGAAAAVVYLYRRASSTPSVPSTTSTFTFATGVLTGHNNSWTQTVPTNDGNPLYVILASALGTGATDTIATGEWSSPAIMAANGTNGTNGSAGANAVTVTLDNVACQLWAYADGSVVSFTQAAGAIKVYDGGTDVTASSTFSASASGCTGTVNTALNTPVTGAIGTYRVTAMSADQATLTITVTYNSIAYVRVFALAKSRGGYEIVGSLPGSNLFDGRVVYLTTNSKLYRYKSGTGWIVDVDGADISSGSVTAAKINVTSLSAISANLGTITAGSLNIGSGKFQVDTSGNVTIYNASSGQRLTISNSVLEVYDSSNVRRVRLGIW